MDFLVSGGKRGFGVELVNFWRENLDFWGKNGDF